MVTSKIMTQIGNGYERLMSPKPIVLYCIVFLIDQSYAYTSVRCTLLQSCLKAWLLSTYSIKSFVASKLLVATKDSMDFVETSNKEQKAWTWETMLRNTIGFRDMKCVVQFRNIKQSIVMLNAQERMNRSFVWHRFIIVSQQINGTFRLVQVYEG